jgi:hypothetical protein
MHSICNATLALIRLVPFLKAIHFASSIILEVFILGHANHPIKKANPNKKFSFPKTNQVP